MSVIPLLRSAFDVCRRRLRRQTHASAVHRSRIRAEYDEQAAVLLVTLREFQKTQVFFSMALQIAALLALNNPTWLDAPTLGQLGFSMVVVALISSTGVYPIVMGLIVLRRSKGLLESFLLAASLACVGVSSATWYRTVHTGMSQSMLRQADYNLAECGNINPIQHCLPSAGNSKSIRDVVPKLDIVQWTAAVPLFMALVLAIERVFPAADWPLPAFMSSSVKRMVRLVVFLVAEAWLVICNMAIMISLCGLWVDKTYEGKVWTVGQVIAAGIFIPVFLEWIFLVICVFCLPSLSALRLHADLHSQGASKRASASAYRRITKLSLRKRITPPRNLAPPLRQLLLETATSEAAGPCRLTNCSQARMMEILASLMRTCGRRLERAASNTPPSAGNEICSDVRLARDGMEGLENDTCVLWRPRCAS